MYWTGDRRTRTHAKAHTHKHTHTHTYTNRHRHTVSHTHTHSHTHTIYTLVHLDKQKWTDTHMHNITHGCARDIITYLYIFITVTILLKKGWRVKETGPHV